MINLSYVQFFDYFFLLCSASIRWALSLRYYSSKLNFSIAAFSKSFLTNKSWSGLKTVSEGNINSLYSSGIEGSLLIIHSPRGSSIVQYTFPSNSIYSNQEPYPSETTTLLLLPLLAFYSILMCIQSESYYDYDLKNFFLKDLSMPPPLVSYGGLNVTVATNLLMWSVTTVAPSITRVRSEPSMFLMSIVGSFIDRSPPSLNERTCLLILDPPIEFNPDSHALYSKCPENLYKLSGPSNIRFVIGGWCDVCSP